MKIEGPTEERNALAFLKWVEGQWTRDDLPREVLYFFYSVEDSVVRR